jgi:GTP-binding protein
MSLISALNALRFAQVVLLVVESQQGKFSKLDLQLARKCLEEGRAVVIAANKRDLVELKGISPRQYEEGVRRHCEAFMREFGEIPIVSCTASASASTGSSGLSISTVEGLQGSGSEGTTMSAGTVSGSGAGTVSGVRRVLDTVLRTHDAWAFRISTWILNKWVKDLMITMRPAKVGSKTLNIKYMAQV